MTTLTVTIPGALDRLLTPNRGQRNPRAKAAARSRAKNEAFLCAKAALSGRVLSDASHATYHIELGKAKGEKQKDADNLVASCKAHLDGIAAALGVDDRGWTLGTVTQVRDPEGTGYLSIRLEWEQAEGAAA